MKKDEIMKCILLKKSQFYVALLPPSSGPLNIITPKMGKIDSSKKRTNKSS